MYTNANYLIKTDQISNTQMSLAVYRNYGFGAEINFEDINLKQEQIEKIISWINNTPESEITTLNETPSNISAGIVLKLKSRKEIRIQYDLKKIYITRSDIKKSLVKYSIEQKNLNDFFNENLKGHYFGSDNVKDS
ncbi:hypothetical protein [Paenibacillus albicereus]|nr:hypothetical protein [Paenibacillus albicereus]